MVVDLHVYHHLALKLFEMMLLAKQHLKQKPFWQYIIFSYNEDSIEKAKEKAKASGVEMIILNSSRWASLDDPLMPKKKENIFIRKELYAKAKT